MWRVPWKQEGQDILGMGRGGRKVERDGRWIMWSMDAGLTGRDGNRGGDSYTYPLLSKHRLVTAVEI